MHLVQNFKLLEEITILIWHIEEAATAKKHSVLKNIANAFMQVLNALIYVNVKIV